MSMRSVSMERSAGARRCCFDSQRVVLVRPRDTVRARVRRRHTWSGESIAVGYDGPHRQHISRPKGQTGERERRTQVTGPRAVEAHRGHAHGARLERLTTA